MSMQHIDYYSWGTNLRIKVSSRSHLQNGHKKGVDGEAVRRYGPEGQVLDRKSLDEKTSRGSS